MKPLRVVMVTRRFWPLMGGPEKLLANLAVELRQRDCETTVLTACWRRKWPEKIDVHGVPVVRLRYAAQASWGTIRYACRLAHWLRANRHRYDVVCVSELKDDAYATLQAIGRRTPVVLRAERSGPSGDCRWQQQTFWRRRIASRCRRAAAIVASSDEIRKELQDSGYPTSRLHSIVNGVPDSAPRTRETRSAARNVLAEANEELHLNPAVLLAVYAGRLEPNRGLDLLLDAWEPIARHRPHARLWLVGDGSLRPALRQRIERSALTGRVLMVGQFDQVDEVLAAADFVVRPTPEAGTSLAVIEALSAGLPVVATDISAHREWITDGENGLLAPCDDRGAWTASIGRFLDDSALAARLGAAARQKAADFALAKMADAHLRLFQELCP